MAQQSQQGAQPPQNLTRGRGAHRPDRQANINSAWTYDVSSGQSTGTDRRVLQGEGGAAGAVPSAAAPTAGQAQDRTLKSWKADDHEKYLLRERGPAAPALGRIASACAATR